MTSFNKASIFSGKITNSVEQSPYFKANRFSASQEIPRILWNPKLREGIHKNLTVPQRIYFIYYRGADKSLARPWKETSYSNRDLQHNTKTYSLQKNSNILLLFVSRTSWYSVVILGRCSLFPSRVGLRTYQHPGTGGMCGM